MKTLVTVAMTLMVTSAVYAAPSINTCYKGGCSTYTRSQALDVLEKYENSSSDVDGNYELVTSIVKKEGYNLKYVVDNFVYLQNELGKKFNNGPGYQTQNARKALKSIGKELSSKIRLHEIVKQYALLLEAENSMTDMDFLVPNIVKYMELGMVPLSSAFDQYISTLNALGGATATGRAWDCFKILMKYQRTFDPFLMHASLKSLVSSAKNDYALAFVNFRVVIKVALKTGSLSLATVEFNQLASKLKSAKKAQDEIIKKYNIK